MAQPAGSACDCTDVTSNHVRCCAQPRCTNARSRAPPADSGRQYDCVLMDMAMPVMGGLEATAAIRAAGHAAVPILAMTANASDRDRQACCDVGMDGFLPKPVLKDQLAHAIATVLASARHDGAG